MKKTLVFYGFTRLDDMVKKGNVWYVRHYERYFDRVNVVFLSGNPHESVCEGNTTLVSLGRRNKIINLICAPFQLYRFSKRLGVCSYLTCDVVFSWWTSWLIKLCLGARIVLMPVCVPEQIYLSSGRSLSGLPFWLERIAIRLSFYRADCVLTGKSFGSFVEWLSDCRYARGKLVTVESLVDSLPTQGFFDQLTPRICESNSASSDMTEFRLIYVGRLHPEKLTDDLIRMMAEVNPKKNAPVAIKLDIVGDGPDRMRLESLVEARDLSEEVSFLGTIDNAELPRRLAAARVFVSPLTGTSLREAALVGLPIVAYDMDWVSGLLRHEVTALLVARGDYRAMADQVLRLVNDEELYASISRNVRELAWRLWSPTGISDSLRKAFGDDYRDQTACASVVP